MTRNTPQTDRADVYTRITAEIIAAIEAGTETWRMPWHHGGAATARPTNLASGKRYRGINVLALWMAAEKHCYGEGLWGTYRQWQAVGAQVRKGEHATSVVLWKEVRAAANDDEVPSDTGDGRRLFARAFCVFNRAQVDGYEPEALPDTPTSDRIARADAFFAVLGIPVTFGPFGAHYRPNEDRIYMPPFSAFDDPALFAATLIHEAAHASGAAHRLDRRLGARFGEASYAVEEMTAELAAGYILADLGVAHHPRPNHAAYIASWIRVLKGDPRAIFTAASKAQQAADWMHARQPAVPALAA